MAIWLRAREEFADNRFQLLFIYQNGGQSFSGFSKGCCMERSYG